MDYNKQFNETLKNLSGRPSLLLHVCCAPCLAGVIGRVEKDFEVTLLFYNPNIRGAREYTKRLEEVNKYLAATGRNIKVLDFRKDIGKYCAAVSEFEPSEGGARCDKCCGLRIERTAKEAAAGGYDYFCTTLTVSPHKNAKEINGAMASVSEKYKIKHLPSDFKKEGGFLVSTKECEKHGVYRQNYCGCRPSKLNVFVTGGLASGKSELVRILGGPGAYTISADEVSRVLMSDGTRLNNEIMRRFPSAATGGSLDRAALRDIVFNDANELAALNAPTHPVIYNEIALLLEKSPARINVVEVPLLFESGLDGIADITVTISADENIRRERYIKRTGLSGGLFDAIAAGQLTDAEREAAADITVINNDGPDNLKRQAEELYKSWL